MIGTQTRNIRKTKGQVHRKLVEIDAALAAVEYAREPSPEILLAIKNKQQEDGFPETLKKLILELECDVTNFKFPNAE